MSEETFDRNSPGYWNDRFEKDWAEKSGPQYTHRYAELLFEHLPGWFTHEIRQSKMSICDWGCAEGEAVGYLGQVLPGQTIAGVDVAPAAI